MTKNTNAKTKSCAFIPIVKPTETEKKIWEQICPKKTGGVVRQGSTKFPHQMVPSYHGPPDKTNLDHWDDKMKGGAGGEWFAYILEMGGAHRILDVGCGFGFPSFYLASCGFEVVGVDPSPSQIAAAEWYRQEEGAEYRLKYQVIEQARLPFEDDSFDGVTMCTSLECVGEPETLMSEVIRVLKPGSTVAIGEEDRRDEPKTHPVWEQLAINVIDDVSYLYYETRVCEPYLDRRYMMRLAEDGKLTGHFRKQAPADVFKWGVGLEDAELSLEQVLSETVGGEYGEAKGYDVYTLKDFLEKMGFTDLMFWPNYYPRKSAEELLKAGVLEDMPDDIRAVCRALARSTNPRRMPITGEGMSLVSCKSP